MKVSLFNYDLPKDFVAQVPVEPRDASRLMVIHRESGAIDHRIFRDLPEYARPGDVIVINDTRVIAARVYGLRRTLGRVEVLFLEKRAERFWDALVGAGGHIMPGERLRLADGAIEVRVAGKDPEGLFSLEVLQPADFEAALEKHGHVPTPPYIDRGEDKARLEEVDRVRYQTVYADKAGAVAAPTAGLHFTRGLLDELRRAGVQIVKVTLHVGLGTFRPVKTEEVERHKMHREYFEVSAEAAAALNAAKREGARVIAVGTTTTRVLESIADEAQASKGYSELFIYPPYRFRRVDALITNFHLPQSTLLMMVAAFAGRERILAAYEEAKQRGYRFYSYGDAMLIL